jgi:hypothetical protein
MNDKLQHEFDTFHADNPEIYTELVDMARQAKALGKTKLGIRMLMETLRWNWTLQTVGDSEYKLNDHFCPFYSRLIMALEPDLRGIFETRRRSGE